LTEKGLLRGELSVIWPFLRVGLWHTTHPDRFLGIMNSGEISPEPDIPNDQRWKASRGATYYPYVRHIGGVSLFDFSSIEPEVYRKECPMCNWESFVPFPEDWEESYWIELKREDIEKNVTLPAELWKRMENELAHAHTLMPRIEAAHLGPVPVTAFKRVLHISAENPTPRALDDNWFLHHAE
jgi:hypothetical protein